MSNNLNKFWKIVDYDQNIAQAVAKLYCETMPELVEDIYQCVEQQDLLMFSNKMHSLTGSIGFIGFDTESKLIDELKNTADQHKRLPNPLELKLLIVSLSNIAESFTNQVLSNQVTYLSETRQQS